MKLNSFELPTPYCILTQDSISYKAKNNRVFLALIGLCYLVMFAETITTQNPMYFLWCIALFLITKKTVETKFNYEKGLDKTPSLFSINLGMMKIMIVDGHVFSPPMNIAKVTHHKFTLFTTKDL